jgi:hypothetical protein
MFLTCCLLTYLGWTCICRVQRLGVGALGRHCVKCILAVRASVTNATPYVNTAI